MLPCSYTAAGGFSTGSKLTVVPDVARVLNELSEIGEGMVEAVHMPKSCGKLPVGSTASTH